MLAGCARGALPLVVMAEERLGAAKSAGLSASERERASGEVRPEAGVAEAGRRYRPQRQSLICSRMSVGEVLQELLDEGRVELGVEGVTLETMV